MNRLIISIFWILAAHTCSWAINYYVSPAGNNRNAGRSVNAPKKTIQGAADLTVPGDTVFVMNGLYTNECSTCEVARLTRSGTPTAYIAFVNYPGHRPKLHFTGWQGFNILNGASYISIIGFEIEGHSTALTLTEALNQPGGCNDPAKLAPDPRFNGNGIGVEGRTGGHPHHLIFTQNNIHHCGGAAIGTNQADYLTIEDNLIYNNSWYSIYATSGISLYQLWNFDTKAGYHNVIKRNRCFNNRQEVPWVVGGCQITDGNGIIIDDNQNQQNNSPLTPYTGRTLIENNILWHNGGAGIQIFLSNHVDIIHNTTYLNNQSDAINGGQILTNRSRDVRIFNNILVAFKGKKINSSIDSQSIEYANNLHFGGGDAKLFNTTCLVADPMFENAGTLLTSDFRLTGSSEAINAGSLQLTSPLDHVRLKRPVNSIPDIGAYEYQGLVTGVEAMPTIGTSVLVYPNPVGDTRTVTIQADQVLQEVVVYNTYGQKIAWHLINSNSLSFVLPDNSGKGIVLIEIKMRNGHISCHKLLIE